MRRRSAQALPADVPRGIERDHLVEQGPHEVIREQPLGHGCSQTPRRQPLMHALTSLFANDVLHGRRPGATVGDIARRPEVEIDTRLDGERPGQRHGHWLLR